MSQKNHDLKDVCKGLHILVVDDIQPNLDLIEAYFEILGCTGDYVKNGLEAVNKVRSKTYDVVLMDFQMPVMGGLEATKVIREELRSDVPIVALTGSATMEDLKKGLSIGMNSCCMKPIMIEELARALVCYKK